MAAAFAIPFFPSHAAYFRLPVKSRSPGLRPQDREGSVDDVRVDGEVRDHPCTADGRKSRSRLRVRRRHSRRRWPLTDARRPPAPREGHRSPHHDLLGGVAIPYSRLFVQGVDSEFLLVAGLL